MGLFFCLAHGQTPCLLGPLINTVCSLTPSNCPLSTLIAAGDPVLCGSNPFVVLNIASGTYNVHLDDSVSFNGLNISTSNSASLTVSLNTAINIAQHLYVDGTAVVNVAQGVVVTVSGDVQVTAQASLQVAGNLTVTGATTVYGTLWFAGTAGQAASAWLVAQANSVTITASASGSANVTGNGGIDGSVVVSGTASIGTGSTFNYISITQDFQVATQSLLTLAGNVTVWGKSTVYGTLVLAGTTEHDTTSWIVAQANGVVASGTADAAAVLKGNGGIDGTVTCQLNVTLAAGNSPGTYWVNGDLDMSSTTTLELDVDSSVNYDRYIISKSFNRNGILYINFENGYVPADGTNFPFATHASSSGSFEASHGNYNDATFAKIHDQYGKATTGFEFGSAAALAAPIVLISLCIFALVF